MTNAIKAGFAQSYFKIMRKSSQLYPWILKLIWWTWCGPCCCKHRPQFTCLSGRGAVASVEQCCRQLASQTPLLGMRHGEDDYHTVLFKSPRQQTRTERRCRTTVRLIGPLVDFINYFDSRSGGRESGQRPIVVSSRSCLYCFHASSCQFGLLRHERGSRCQKAFCRPNTGARCKISFAWEPFF